MHRLVYDILAQVRPVPHVLVNGLLVFADPLSLHREVSTVKNICLDDVVTRIILILRKMIIIPTQNNTRVIVVKKTRAGNSRPQPHL